jgi:hypothetical protein
MNRTHIQTGWGKVSNDINKPREYFRCVEKNEKFLEFFTLFEKKFWVAGFFVIGAKRGKLWGVGEKS